MRPNDQTAAISGWSKANRIRARTSGSLAGLKPASGSNSVQRWGQLRLRFTPPGGSSLRRPSPSSSRPSASSAKTAAFALGRVGLAERGAASFSSATSVAVFGSLTRIRVITPSPLRSSGPSSPARPSRSRSIGRRLVRNSASGAAEQPLGAVGVEPGDDIKRARGRAGVDAGPPSHRPAASTSPSATWLPTTWSASRLATTSKAGLGLGSSRPPPPSCRASRARRRAPGPILASEETLARSGCASAARFSAAVQRLVAEVAAGRPKAQKPARGSPWLFPSLCPGPWSRPVSRGPGPVRGRGSRRG